jgi:RNA-directed DNA polymerase
VISPLLANIYLHYALDQWVEAWRKKEARGDVVMVRYADDFVMGFQERADAERFLEELRERLRKFGLELHPDKTRLIVFGRKPENDWRWKGGGKPGTFDFLGFTHSCGRNRKGYFTVRRDPDSDARVGSRGREVAEIGRTGLLQLPCDTGQ